MGIDRKYGQKGYMESYREGKGEKGEKREPKPRPAGPRWQQQERPQAPRMPGRREISRCGGCGAVLPTMLESAGQCPKCGFELHSCKQCRHFDPGSRFECRKPVKKRLAQKDARNDCELYEIRATLEREAAPSRQRPQDARRAFENLFKK